MYDFAGLKCMILRFFGRSTRLTTVAANQDSKASSRESERRAVPIPAASIFSRRRAGKNRAPEQSRGEQERERTSRRGARVRFRDMVASFNCCRNEAVTTKLTCRDRCNSLTSHETVMRPRLRCSARFGGVALFNAGYRQCRRGQLYPFVRRWQSSRFRSRLQFLFVPRAAA
jgi:hypothetical protein